MVSNEVITVPFILSMKGLRFSGVNETEYRVYLLGNPVGVTFCLLPMLALSYQHIHVLKVNSSCACSSGDLVA